MAWTEILQTALVNTLLGMGTVFFVLIFISLVISMFVFIPKIQAMFSKEEPEPPSPAPFPVPEMGTEAEVRMDDELELAAVIAAAVAAYEGTSPEGLIIRSIKRAKRQNW